MSQKTVVKQSEHLSFIVGNNATRRILASFKLNRIQTVELETYLTENGVSLSAMLRRVVQRELSEKSIQYTKPDERKEESKT
jgi:hypothetical protein